MKSKKKKSPSYILIHKRLTQAEAVLLQDTNILSYFIYSPLNRSQVGSIFKGEVTRVLPSIGACFVDIGWPQEVFLHQKEIVGDSNQDENLSLQEKIQVGQKIRVQITKDPIGSKSARASMVIRLVGSKLIYMPQLQEGIGISKKITDEKERQRLKEVLSELKIKGKVIVRTKSVGQTDFQTEIDHLYTTWEQLKKNKRRSKGLILEEIPEEIQFLRNHIQKNTQVLIDHELTFQTAMDFVKRYMPEFKNQISYYKKEDLFKKFSIEKKLKQAYKNKVYLKSGGSLHIEETEALVSIDVNTAHATQKKSQELTNVHTNSEAVKEITSQLRIRNLGGIIMIDLINMEEESSQQKVLSLLKEELQKDPIPTEFISFSSLQVVQMVRKRTQKSLRGLTCQKCLTCKGKGFLKKPRTVALEIFKEILEKREADRPTQVVIQCHPTVSEWIQENEDVYLDFILQKRKKKLLFKAQDSLHPEYFEFDKSRKNMRKGSV